MQQFIKARTKKMAFAATLATIGLLFTGTAAAALPGVPSSPRVPPPAPWLGWIPGVGWTPGASDAPAPPSLPSTPAIPAPGAPAPQK